MRTFNHIGIVTNDTKENASLNADLGIWLTDFSKSPNKIEFLKFIDGSRMPELVQKVTHIAYEVPCLADELANAKVLFGPYVCNERLTIAFIEEEGIPLELMEFKS